MMYELRQFIYRFSYWFVMSCLLCLRPFLNQKTKDWINLRNKINSLSKPSFNSNKIIWFHAASGEIEYCKSVIKELKSLSPDCQIALSYSSPSAEKLFENIKSSVDFIFPLPWDSMKDIKKILRSIQPHLVVFSRTDFWPELIYQSHKIGISLAAISIFPQKNNFLSRWNYSWLLKRFQYVTTVDNQSLNYLQQILPDLNIKNYPDSRFDQVIHRLQAPTKINFSSCPSLFTMGSTWPEDEFILLPTVSPILQNNMKIVLAPHDISRASELLSKIQTLHPDLKIKLLSDFIEKQSLFDILIVDRVGYLADIYRYSTFTFIGGSFKKRVHSVMEPLCALNIVMFGPHYKNNPEAIQTLHQNLSFEISSSKDVIDLIQSHSSTDLQKIRAEIKAFVQNQTGSSRTIALELLKI